MILQGYCTDDHQVWPEHPSISEKLYHCFEMWLLYCTWISPTDDSYQRRQFLEFMVLNQMKLSLSYDFLGRVLLQSRILYGSSVQRRSYLMSDSSASHWSLSTFYQLPRIRSPCLSAELTMITQSCFPHAVPTKSMAILVNLWNRHH